MLERKDLKQLLSGDDLADVTALYRDYCAKTNWPLPAAPTSFFPIYERDKGCTTRCFSVAFADGSAGRFSLDKALRAVAI